jgi:hypothetical protein
VLVASFSDRDAETPAACEDPDSLVTADAILACAAVQDRLLGHIAKVHEDSKDAPIQVQAVHIVLLDDHGPRVEDEGRAGNHVTIDRLDLSYEYCNDC